MPLVSLDDVASFQPAVTLTPVLVWEPGSTHPLGTVGGVELSRPAAIKIKSPAWWLGIVIDVAWAVVDAMRLIAISAQTRPFAGTVVQVHYLAKFVVGFCPFFFD